MAKFGTQEWYDVYMEEINNSKSYEEAARTWEGDFYFIVEKGGPVKEPIYENGLISQNLKKEVM
jgi:hypothetical protein